MSAKYYLEIFGKKSKLATIPPYTGHIIITGDTSKRIDSRWQLRKWLLDFSETFGFIAPKATCRNVVLDGFEGLLGILAADNAHVTVRTVRGGNNTRIDVDVLFLSMISIDDALLSVVEDMQLKTLEWLFVDRNNGLNIIEDDDRFDSVIIKEPEE
ncbi:MAG: hypothetical protein ACO3CH_00205 [Ilumatobacteraceae bacterium]